MMNHNAYARKFNMAVELKYGGRAGMAVPLFKELADEGDAKSMLELANCYDEGLGVEQDYEIAKKLYEKAAEQEEPNALLSVGYNYFLGLYGKPNFNKAMEYYERAAEEIPWLAWFCIARLYEGWEGMPYNPKKYFQYIELSASQDYPYAAYKLALCYLEGIGTAKDEALGMEWMEHSADDLECEEAQLWLGDLYSPRNKKLSSDLKLALEWYEQAAGQRNKLALMKLGDLYGDKKLSCYDVAKAKECFTQAFDMDCEKNLQRQFELCTNEENVDFDTYLQLYRRAASLGLAEGQYLLARLYTHGSKILVLNGYRESAKLLEKAAAQGHTDAMCALSVLYCEGKGVEKNELRAFDLAHMAALAGNVKAYDLIGDYYTKGIGVLKDLEVGYKWYCQAAQCGSESGKGSMAVCLAIGDGVKQDIDKANALLRGESEEDENVGKQDSWWQRKMNAFRRWYNV
ncbi:MAG: sel1 repeat family protein [Acidaminococcaceae bacterium]|nr:sel1 repeat family protein [Acidaminococcaceae bacterium]